MELIAVKRDGTELGLLRDVRKADIDIGVTNDFAITFDAASWIDNEVLANADYWYAEGYGEIGGRIQCVKSMTQSKQVQLSGYTWRGLLAKKIIEPDAGMDYKTVSGEANTVLAGLITSRFGGFFTVSGEDSGIDVGTYQFNRYCTLLDGIVDMLHRVGARIDISYRCGTYELGSYVPGAVVVRAVPIVDYSNEIEYSQDGKIDFVAKDYRMGVNHLICLGQGDLKERQVVHLYMDSAGTVSTEQSLFGFEEITEVYDYSSAESTEELIKGGTARLRERANYKKLEIALNDIDAEIGDIVGGRERVTGIALKKQIKNIILKIDSKGRLKITHKVGD